MSELILHAYDASPFTQKALKMLALHGAGYRYVETPMIAPKPDLTVLTGGYRGTPVLQDGADVYVDNARIAAALESRGGASLSAGALEDAAAVIWGEQFFEAGLHMAIDAFADDWEPTFANDRRAVFARLDFDDVRARVDDARGLLRAQATRVERQLGDGRAFIHGDRLTLTDLHGWAVLWFVRAAFPDSAALLGDLEHLPAWEARIAELGEGERAPMPAAEAHAVARVATPVGSVKIDALDPQRGLQGQVVLVSATTSKRGDSRGRLVGLDSDEIVIEIVNETVGSVHAHFPRLGYRIESA